MSSNNNVKDDALMAPIPRKKRPTPSQAQLLPASASTAKSGSSILPVIPKKDSFHRKLTSFSTGNKEDRPSSITAAQKKERRPSYEHHGSIPRSSTSSEDNSTSLSRLSSRSKTMKLMSEAPLLLRIKVQPGLLGQRSSQRGAKRSRPQPQYQEVDLTDSDDFMTDDEAPPKKKGRLIQFSKIANKKRTDAGSAHPPTEAAATAVGGLEETANFILSNDGVNPPEGALSTLWYSREDFSNLFVMEKALGFKTRPTARLVKASSPSETSPTLSGQDTLEQQQQPNVAPMQTSPDGPTENALVLSGPDTQQPDASPMQENSGSAVPDEKAPASASAIPKAAAPDRESGKTETHILDKQQAIKIQQVLLQNGAFWGDLSGRMEVSRLAPQQCPVVLMAAALREQYEATLRKRQPIFKLEMSSTQEEELLLVKWRGRSHLHCSWERPIDIQRADTSNNSTARNKIRRYYQAQEAALGYEWKKVLSKKELNPNVADSTSMESEEYYSPQCLEVERIMCCDETEMDLDVLARQRGKNMQDEQDALRRREEAQNDDSIQDHSSGRNVPSLGVVPPAHEPTKKLLESSLICETVLRPPGEEAWDPEDNVRYVVKWKGMPYADVTWEYWRDIKRDAVVQAEDYWYRQRSPPDIPRVPHPHIRDFKKLQESPVFGLSTRKRRCIGYDDNNINDDSFEGFKLRSYQLEGVNWLLFNWWNRRSAILADEMGLGKTIQSTAFLRELQTNPNTQVRGPFLIVAPLSLAGQWQSELASWAPDMNVVLYHGSEKARDFLVQEEFYYKEPFVNKATASKLKKNHVTKFHVLITTYEIVLKDSSVLSKLRWSVLIVDEAHRLKNHTSRLFDELAAVPRDHCVLLTGTPIANATEELWALLNFANPSAFTDRHDFLEKFGQMTGANQVNELHNLLRPYLLRRVKEDVEKSLPPKEETVLEVSLTPIQKAYYKAIYERNTSFLFKGAKANNAPSLMNVMMELRKCCNHPFLIKGAEDRILADAATKQSEKNQKESEPVPIDYARIFHDQLVKSSGKMVLIEKLLNKLFAGGHKVLIFSQMVRLLDLLEEFLKLQKYRYERLDGTTSSSSRSAAVERFTRKSFSRFVMLLSTRAGGLGLNLTAADTVIIFDSDWNPQNDLQAMARAHRIGQERRVMIYRLLTAKTYEMHMFHSASLKLGLERAVLSQNREQGEDSSEDKSKKKKDRDAQAKQIDELLKKGAYDVFREDDDGEAEKFMEKDIDQLLEHNSKTVTYGASATSSLGSGLGSFSKASFVADTGDGAKDVDISDPDFWSKYDTFVCNSIAPLIHFSRTRALQDCWF